MKIMMCVAMLVLGLISPVCAEEKTSQEQVQEAIDEGEAFAAAGDYDSAISSYGKALIIDPTLEVPLTPRVLELFRLKRGEVEYVEPVLHNFDYEEYMEGYEREKQEKAEEEKYRQFREDFEANDNDSQQGLCRYCNGSGKVWQGGGATQSAASEPSGMSASQREDFYNSSASIKTTYSSGGSAICSKCNGTGRN